MAVSKHRVLIYLNAINNMKGCDIAQAPRRCLLASESPVKSRVASCETRGGRRDQVFVRVHWSFLCQLLFQFAHSYVTDLCGERKPSDTPQIRSLS
jgi:hypothetical protein